MILKKKHVRAGSIFIGLSFILVGPFFDLFRGKPLEMGFIQQSLIIVGLAVLLFGFLLDKQYSSLKAPLIFFGVILLFGVITTPIINGAGLAFSLHSLPFICGGIIFILFGFYFGRQSNRNVFFQKCDTADPKGRNSFPYRPEIDGLRALAVVSVLLYHLKVDGFAGGFVGVDVFFVISGFLITSILLREAENNSFSLVDFYERRIRRIFPALFVVIFFVGLVGYYILDPETYADLGQSAFSTTFFVSNFQLWHQAGYFDKPAELKPLLHTWSLAVEEQFYIFFPPLFVFVWKTFKKNAKFVVLLLLMLSFMLSEIWLAKDSSAAFYLLPFRSWELLLGSVLAIGTLPELKGKTAKQILSFVGMLFVLIAIFTYSVETRFPGFAALLPTIGAFLIIYAAREQETLVGTVLSWRPFVFIGKISYSLYLWHWVLIVMARYYYFLPLSNWHILLLAIASFVLSSLAWKFVENPFRNKKTFGRKFVFSAGLFLMLVVGVSGYVISEFRGFPNRFEPLPEYAKSVFGTNDELRDCIDRQDRLIFDKRGSDDNLKLLAGAVCHVGAGDGPVRYAVVGDSHARSLAFGISESFDNSRINGVIFYQTGCPPLLGSYVEGNSCIDPNKALISYLTQHSEIQTVFLVSRWAIYANGTFYNGESDTIVNLYYEGQSEVSDIGDNEDRLAYGLDRFIDELLNAGKQVVFVNDIPEVGYNVPIVYQKVRQSTNEQIGPTYKEFQDRYQAVFNVVDVLQEEYPSIKVIDLYKLFCDNRKCYVEKDGTPLYMDTNHLNIYGSQLASKAFVEYIEVNR